MLKESLRSSKMAGASQFFFYVYALTIIIFACLIEDLANKVRSTLRFVSNSVGRPIATARFVKLLDAQNPARRYRMGMGMLVEPTDCRVCLSRMEEGETIRNLKCNHTFHKACVDAWLQQDSAVACPLCRSAVLPEEIILKLRQRVAVQGYGHGGGHEDIIYPLSSSQGSW